MALLTKENKNAGDGKVITEDVYVPDLEADVRIRSMSEAEYEEFQDSLYKRRGKNVEANTKMVRRRLVALSAVYESGEMIWNEEDLKRKPTRAVSQMVAVAMRVNGMDDSDLAELAGAKPKNSETGRGAGSCSSSVSTPAATP